MAVQPDFAFVAAGVSAEQRCHQLGAACTDQPGDAEDFPVFEAERNIVDPFSPGVVDVVAGDVAGLKNDLANVVWLGGVEVAHFPSDHLGDDLWNIQVGHAGRGDVFAVTDHRNGVAHSGHFIELVGDVDAGDTLGFEVADDVQQHLDFRTGQG
ncbi:hypothetical protein D3C87_1426080 [compost metagenome]